MPAVVSLQARRDGGEAARLREQWRTEVEGLKRQMAEREEEYEAWLQGTREGADLRLEQTEVGGRAEHKTAVTILVEQMLHSLFRSRIVPAAATLPRQPATLLAVHCTDCVHVVGVKRDVAQLNQECRIIPHTLSF
jgi:hypothetical protein